MNPRNTLSLLLILIALAMGGCRTQPPIPQTVDVEFTLKTSMLDGKMVFVGVGGELDGVVNPDLHVNPGDTVRIVLVNADGMPHDLAIPEWSVQTSLVSTQGQTTEAVFVATEIGQFQYYCTVSGHRQMGMEGKLTVTEP